MTKFPGHSTEKSVDSDADDDVSFRGLEFLITLWEHPHIYSVATKDHTATEINDDAGTSAAQRQSVAPLQFLLDDNSRAIHSSMWSLNHGTVPGTPTSFQSFEEIPSSTTSSWPRSSSPFCSKS